MTQTPHEDPETTSDQDLVPDEPADPFAEETELRRDEAAQRGGSGDVAPDQPWT